MKHTYRAHFERTDFTQRPPLTERVTVQFKSSISPAEQVYSHTKLMKVERRAWNKLWKKTDWATRLGHFSSAHLVSIEH